MIADQLARLVAPDAAYSGWDDASWSKIGGMTSAAGMVVTPETAMKISAFFGCVRVIGETMLSAPLPIYRRLPNGDRELAPEHPLWPLLHGDMPNDEQTSGEWIESHAIATAMRGKSYSEIKGDLVNPVTELDYLHPDRVREERLPSGLLRYRVKDEYTGMWRPEPVAVEDMYVFPGLYGGLSVLEAARESLGISMALQNFAGRTFNNGVRTSGVLETSQKFEDEEAIKRLRNQWQEVYGGSANAGKTIILEEGMQYKAISMSNSDAQMLASEQWQVNDVARFFRMPLIMIQEYANSTNWGTGIESTQIGFITFTMLPWFIRMEQRVNKMLVRPIGRARAGDYYAEFNIENLLRGDNKSRMEAYQIAAGGNAPWMHRNEVRRKENMNAGPPELSEFLQPMNMGTAGQQATPRGTISRPAGAQTDPRLRGFTEVLVGQIMRKESEAVRRAAVRFADDGEGWSKWAHEFYDNLAGDLDERRMLPPEQARSYATGRRDDLLSRGAAAVEADETTRTAALVGLVLEATK